ncbi:hypothetical protein [Hyalangium rubrum]|uniref:Uncharacterized protein n=1 Tax=Hyalangium rubrum TaxID=3103134 RepID=A0ABU5HDC5_9BACT|nr:hypothetical protein [Hyalangium sp. s54d21]MDY7231099.1 hypothetical protein [Hyalangium sp. s54d21]
MAGDSEDYPPDPLDDDPDFAPHGSRESRAGFVPEFVRKMAVAGLGAIFMTEEGIRNLAGQLKLPKEVLGFILSQAERTKDEIGRVLAEEVRRFLQSEKLREEFVKLMSGMTLDVRAQIRLVPADEEKKEGTAEAKASEGASAEPKVVISELNARRGGKRTKKE